MMSLAVQGLLDRQAITEVLYRYCRGCDRADEALLRSCFHPGSRHAHGGFRGSSEDFCGFALGIIRRALRTKHVLTNVSIELDGDLASSEAHYSAYHRILNRETGLEEDNFSGGRYLDRLERREGRWAIVERVGLIDYETFEAAAERGMAALPPRALSRRWPDDELYEWLRAAGPRTGAP